MYAIFYPDLWVWDPSLKVDLLEVDHHGGDTKNVFLNFGRFGPPGPRDPLQRLGRIGGNRSPLFPSKSVVIGPIWGQKTVWPMYALVYPGVGPL